MAEGELGAAGGLSLVSSPQPFPGWRCRSPYVFIQVLPSHHLPSESWEAFSCLAGAADAWLGPSSG